MFQFPSNGKVDPNYYPGMEKATYEKSFNSLQTGKWILTLSPLSFRWSGFCFNSLQTGKWILTSAACIRIRLLILSFNSLQTGKWILTSDIDTLFRIHYEEFQFPSNGKVDPNKEPLPTVLTFFPSFNSLQTGKWILTQHFWREGAPLTSVSIPFKRESGS